MNDPKTLVGFLIEDRDRYLKPLRKSLGCWTNAIAIFLLCRGFVGTALALFFVGWLASRLRPPKKTVEPLLTLPPVSRTFPCDVEILRNGQLLGWDRGVVNFVDGWLNFEGYRTGFSL
ncbi:hypothetical protein EON82_25780 [bacterium]|nr:MAG: hypothetical protein EON82_25780 [bacterium]